eukprot:TRINITY_DN65751_c1_g2_i1.p1 TRINITY_DN65751_c1_g2~~TRINITY_DN65751_c1_g2_i1.p1  ORF type:complete len:957 (-),score=493.92 TRINITY_DN65751_c1_g2_i1:499-3369(-)
MSSDSKVIGVTEAVKKRKAKRKSGRKRKGGDKGEAHSIKVMARFRPEVEQESSMMQGNDMRVVYGEDEQTMKIMKNVNSKKPVERTYTFDRVFNPESTQDKVFDHLAKESVLDVFQGMNGTILAYGQTGSGKTWSMFGGAMTGTTRGIIPRSTEFLFEQIKEHGDASQVTVKMSFLEIYKERVRDLLNEKVVTMKIRENKAGAIEVIGLVEEYVASPEEVIHFIKIGNSRRHTSRTRMNDFSSRSHALLTITVTQKMSDASIRVGKLHLADLAGSERADKSGLKGVSLSEAKKINQSLSALGNCINALTDRRRTHVPFRDSKLTFLLKDSLGGNTKTSLLVTCSPHAINLDETISALKFAQRAKHIKNRVRVNRQLSVFELKDLVGRLRQQLADSRAQVSEMDQLGDLNALLQPSNILDDTDVQSELDRRAALSKSLRAQSQDAAKMAALENAQQGAVSDAAHSSVGKSSDGVSGRGGKANRGKIASKADAERREAKLKLQRQLQEAKRRRQEIKRAQAERQAIIKSGSVEGGSVEGADDDDDGGGNDDDGETGAETSNASRRPGTGARSSKARRKKGAKSSAASVGATARRSGTARSKASRKGLSNTSSVAVGADDSMHATTSIALDANSTGIDLDQLRSQSAAAVTLPSEMSVDDLADRIRAAKMRRGDFDDDDDDDDSSNNHNNNGNDDDNDGYYRSDDDEEDVDGDGYGRRKKRKGKGKSGRNEDWYVQHSGPPIELPAADRTLIVTRGGRWGARATPGNLKIEVVNTLLNEEDRYDTSVQYSPVTSPIPPPPSYPFPITPQSASPEPEEEEVEESMYINAEEEKLESYAQSLGSDIQPYRPMNRSRSKDSLGSGSNSNVFGPIEVRVDLVPDVTAGEDYDEEDVESLGFVEVMDGGIMLQALRRKIQDELDDVPPNFIFLRKDVPIGHRQETKRSLKYIVSNDSIRIRADV